MELDELPAHSLTETGPALAEILVGHYFTAIYRLANSILGDPDEADDATQETFLRALRAWESLEPGTNLKAWLATITIRLCRDRLRRRQVRVRLEGILQHLHLANPPPPSPEEALIENQKHASLWAEVQKLDDKHRLPVILRFANSLTVSEIAQALALPEGTVHSRLHYAVRKLGALVAQWKEE